MDHMAARATHAYNVADFYITENDHHSHFSRKYVDHDQHVNKPGADRVSGLPAAHHRRSNSVHVGSASRGFGWEEEGEGAAAAKADQLVRFRSHRMFSCVTPVLSYYALLSVALLRRVMLVVSL